MGFREVWNEYVWSVIDCCDYTNKLIIEILEAFFGRKALNRIKRWKFMILIIIWSNMGYNKHIYFPYALYISVGHVWRSQI